MGRVLALVAAFVVTLGGATFAGVHIISAVERQTVSTTTYSLKVGTATRQYEVIKSSALSGSSPIIVGLSGAAASLEKEIPRDGLVPYATADKVELVYPVPIDESWNAIGCCDGAAKANVDDVGFIKALVATVDPGHTRPIYVVGYSNGGRLAYRMACTDPTLFDGMAAVKADPMPGCVVTKPENVIVFSSENDKYVPFEPGEKGLETPSATVQIATLEADLKCSDKKVAQLGGMTVTTWSCADGKTLEWAVDKTGAHGFPAPAGATPGADQLIWSLMSKTAVAPVPG